MIGVGFKKLAAEYGMKTDHGVAYGNLQGFAAAFSESSGWKKVVFSTFFADPVQKTMFMDAAQSVDLKKTYRVLNFTVSPDSVQVIFRDGPGTLGKIREFLTWFIPLLQNYGASAWNVCSRCAEPIADGKWMLIHGDTARHYHQACAETTAREVLSQNEQRMQAETGSYATGTIGALVGALLGSVVWAVVLVAGYVASVVGLLIGWLADRGYRLLKGKNGKGKVAILILAVILGVVAGTIAAEAISLAQIIDTPQGGNLTYGDIPSVIAENLANNSEYQAIVAQNIGMGLLFAALGVYWFVIRTGKEVAGEKIIELK